MNLISAAVFISMFLGLVYGMSSPCLTRDGTSGDCVLLTQCKPLLRAFLALNENSTETNQDMALLRQSTCGSPKADSLVPKVCCPRQVYSVNGPCSTPDGQPGKCVSIYSCPHISDMLKPSLMSNEVYTFVEKLKCPSSGQDTICCGLPLVPSAVFKSRVKLPSSVGGCQAQMSAFLPDPSTQCCGKMASEGNKIVGGPSTLIDEHPWTALIEYIKNKDGSTALSCGGSLISSKYVLTAGHCISGIILDVIGRPKRVRLGEYDTTHEGMDCVAAAGGGKDCTDGAISIDIEKTIPHPKYNQKQSRDHDIAMIRLKETAPFTDFIRPVCLPTKDLTLPENTPPSFSMYAVGWGKTKDKKMSDVKIKVTLPFVSLEKCKPVFSKIDRTISLWKGQLCAGGEKGKDTCKGYSGGPLVYENQTRFDLIGVVSFGLTKCGTEGVPGVYTNVYEYLDWIKSVIVA